MEKKIWKAENLGKTEKKQPKNMDVQTDKCVIEQVLSGHKKREREMNMIKSRYIYFTYKK